MSALTTPTTGTQSTSATVSETLLDVNGKLNCQLNRTLDHLPRKPKRTDDVHCISGVEKYALKVAYCTVKHVKSLIVQNAIDCFILRLILLKRKRKYKRI